MPSFADSIFLFLLALLLFGPKQLPVLARELGKWMGEFRRASNEFKMQMEDELRASEQTERQKQIVAMEAAAPIPPPLEEPEEHPHLRSAALPAETPGTAEPTVAEAAAEPVPVQQPEPVVAQTADGSRPVPIATAGTLHMMPPPTGLPMGRGRAAANSNAGSGNALAGLVASIPAESVPAAHDAATEPLPSSPATESVAHGD